MNIKAITSGAIVLSQVLILSSCNPKPEPETYLIPQGFRGRATVIFNRQEGAPARYESGRRVYKMPLNGILLTQFKDEYGIIDHRYYYVDSGGKRTALQIYQYEYNKDGTTKWAVKNSDEVGIFLDGTTGQYGGSAQNKSAAFQLFIVSSGNQLDSFYSQVYQRDFDDKIRTLTSTNL